MTNRLKLLAYWPSRKESAVECTERLSRLLTGLSTCAPLLQTWYETGWTLKDASRRRINPTDEAALLALVEGGRNRTDVGGEVIHNLGFRIGLWTGGKSAAAVGLSVGCGKYDEGARAGNGVVNSVVIDFPIPLGDLGELPTMTALMSAVVLAWRPARAVVTSRAAMQARSFDARHPFVDWLTYVPATGLNAGSEFSMTTLPGVGSIVSSGAEPPGSENPLTPEYIRAVETLLMAAGGSEVASG